jgi:hypothetical protein
MELESARAAMHGEVPFVDALLRALARDGAEVADLVRADGCDQPAWLAQIRPDRALMARFGMGDELLVLVVGATAGWPELRAAQARLQQPRSRLEPDVVLVVDGGEQLAERLGMVPRQREHRIPWDLDDTLAELLQRWLPRYDLFDTRDPVRGRHVFGRRAERAQLTQLLGTGGCVGVFGLRKIGKTTLVHAVTDALDQAGEHAAWVDAQGLVHRDAHHLARALLRDLGAEPESESRDELQALDAALGSLLAGGDYVTLVVDEFDFLVEGTTQDKRVLEGLVGFFGLCRAWSQRTRGRLALVLVGRDPEHVLQPRIGGLPNPLLAWLRELWLGPLPPDEAEELLVSMGRKVGLSIGRETVAACLSWTGGHPMLVRRFGSCALAVARRTERWDTDQVLARVEDAFAGDRAAHTIAAEVEALLRERYPAAFERLCARAAGHDSPRDPVLQRLGLEIAGDVPLLWRQWFRAVRPLAVAS